MIHFSFEDQPPLTHYKYFDKFIVACKFTFVLEDMPKQSKKRKQWSKENMIRAVKAVTNKETGYQKASKLYEVPKGKNGFAFLVILKLRFLFLLLRNT
ncbi:unnamed protein product [Acanthoscelides obtectus]|uniref:HTH psq-type domain-containing protein n=1 Tax=Acanthoscelides obtectus TaxID=200917 RepID=A0A9P0JX72_ACAOB|nr:unnamed protein product [Acanthoscelides obtectus]CAK1633863.1 hypothetical protein AOBTE_LOCUS8446 [Acanthoscelides obtectus]